MPQKVFVSPGVYTSEKDLTFVTRQVGVTTLGLVGETTIGPAFQPIFISNYGEFQSFFGGLNATKVKDTGAPWYELPYIAKSYLSQSNQLFVTRVLGLSGFDAGLAWVTSMKKDFIAKDIILAAKEKGPVQKLVGFKMIDRGIPRHDYEIADADGNIIGKVTSGTQSPVLQQGIGLGYVAPDFSKVGTEIFIPLRGKLLKAEVVKTPFV